jgi:sugar lactone lactonase YvrE
MATDLTSHEWAEMDAEASRSAHGGWISPEGRFWPCRDLFHSLLASRIVRELQLPNTFSNMCLLEDSGWVHVMDDGTVHRSLLHGELTQAQLDALFDIASAHPSMRSNLMLAINAAPGAVEDRDQ